jgi:hypothetical protein
VNILYFKQNLGVLMALTSLAEKIDFVRQTRSANYRESLRLEGVEVKSANNKTTKESVIAKYKALAS